MLFMIVEVLKVAPAKVETIVAMAMYRMPEVAPVKVEKLVAMVMERTTEVVETETRTILMQVTITTQVTRMVKKKKQAAIIRMPRAVHPLNAPKM